jgi:hypothetical protein
MPAHRKANMLSHPSRAASTLALALVASAWSQTLDMQASPLDRLEDNELGVSLSGKARSQMLRAAVSGDSVRLGQPTHENNAFTQADIVLTGRPTAQTRGSVVFRVHQDWNNYYDEGPNPINTRWFNFQGSIPEDRLKFNVGDFRHKLSPLLIHASEPALLMEPEIFADRRRLAMDEWFLGDNRLPLQGLQGTYSFSPLSTLRLEAGGFGARLRSADAATVTWAFQSDDVEKYAGAASLKAVFKDALEVEATHLQVTDRVVATRARVNGYHTLKTTAFYEDARVEDGRLGLDVGSLIGSSTLSLRLGAEFAMSAYTGKVDSAFKDSIGTHIEKRPNPNPADPTPIDAVITDYRTGLVLVEREKLDGQAISADLHAGFAPEGGAFGVALDLAYHKTDKDFVNDLAQTPVFGMSRILNSKTGIGGYRGGYSTLDALYNHTYSVDPITSVNSSEPWGQTSTYRYNGTNNWFRAAQFKSAYTYSTATKVERDAMGQAGDAASPLDPHVQLLFPYGPATPNRDGINSSLTLSAMERKLEAKVLFAALKEPEAVDFDSLSAEPADYARLGGGLTARVNEFFGWSERIELSGSWVEDSRKRPAYTSKGVSVAANEFKSAMLNAGAYLGVWKRVALLAGYQQIKSNPVVSETRTATSLAFNEGDLTQSQWAAGLELKLTHGAYVTAEYGLVDVKEAKTGAAFKQDVSSVNLLLAF